MDESKGKILSALGYLVRQRRTGLGISQEELGLRANLDRTYISGVERGVRATEKIDKGIVGGRCG